MNRTDVLRMWDYHCWANERIFAAAGQLTAEQLQTPLASGYGTLFMTMAHIVDAQTAWRLRATLNRELVQSDFLPADSFAELHTSLQREAGLWRELLAGMDDAQLLTTMQYRVDGQLVERAYDEVVYHLTNHATYHRGEIAAALTALDASPGELDYGVFVPYRVLSTDQL
jgi:uncharacterized damage-inducible protein DinB